MLCTEYFFINKYIKILRAYFTSYSPKHLSLEWGFRQQEDKENAQDIYKY